MFKKITVLVLLPVTLFANGLIDRANEQYLGRDFTPAGLLSADNARYNYIQVTNKTMDTEAQFARARSLQASHFLLFAKVKNSQTVINDAVTQSLLGTGHFERNYGRSPLDNSSLSERGRKIYADLLFWKGMIFTEMINAPGGGSQSEWQKVLADMQLLVNKGYGCMNDGGPYRVLGNFQKAFECTLIPSTSLNWNGWNALAYANQLAGSNRAEAVKILKQFISIPAERISLDFVPENKKAQIEAAEKLKSWGLARPSEFVPGEFVVQLKNEGAHVGTFKKQSFDLSFGGEIKDIIDNDILVIKRPAIELLSFSLQSLKENPRVRLAEPNYIYHASLTPNDPKYGELWNMSNAGQLDSKGRKGLNGVDIDIERAWSITTGNRDIIVGIIDTGIDFSIPDLKDTAWVNEAELKGKPGVDDDGNGYVDDINGYDFINNKGNVVDDNGHGSHVSGVIGARGSDGVGIAGINWNVRLMALKFLGSSGNGNLDAAIKAIRYATKMGARITNNSWGSGENSEILKGVIQEANAAGVLFVAAAGNAGQNNDVVQDFPSGYDVPNIISVASINNRGQLSHFSNYGLNSVHIAAPGENILSTIPEGFASWSGTSMASPHVAGVAALPWGHEPALKMPDVKARLFSSAAPLAGLKGKIKTGGIINAYSALTQAPARPDPYDPEKWQVKPWLLSSDHSYKNSIRNEYEFKIPGATAVAVHFARFQIESGYDRVFFSDNAGNLLGVWSGEHNNEFAPFAEGDSIRIQFITDSLITDYGFDVDKVTFQ